MNSRRSNIEIIADILRMGRASKTQIMYRAAMSYSQLQKYLDYLLDRDFLNLVQGGYPGGTYHVTEKGRELLESIEKIEEVLSFGEGGSQPNYNISEAIGTSRTQSTASTRMPEPIPSNRIPETISRLARR
jgi:molybdate transport repressor ModE-like protein